MGRRPRIIGYGASLAVVLAGSLLAVFRQDVFADAVAVALVSLGLVAATSLVFYEIGLSEDRDRARETAARRPGPAAEPGEPEVAAPAHAEPPRRLVRPRRTRGPR